MLADKWRNLPRFQQRHSFLIRPFKLTKLGPECLLVHKESLERLVQVDFPSLRM